MTSDDFSTQIPVTPPPEERLAEAIVERPGPPGTTRLRLVGWLLRIGRLDRTAYRAVAGTSTPVLDAPLRRLTVAANFSRLWLAIGAGLALVGGKRGRRAALTGVAAIGATSLLVNQPIKSAYRRARPDRERLGVPERRWVVMPDSTSFPSGHSASAAAFTLAVGRQLPAVNVPLRILGGVVAFSRVYVGVHYPGDVLAGWTCGALIGQATSTLADRISSGKGGAPGTR
ncbi:MAG: phosphatase PAP2 family protein [Actinomycetes bacterium]